MEGTKPIIMEGTPPLTGRALPNLINAVRMFNVKINVFISALAKTALVLTLTLTFRPHKSLVRARPAGAGCPP